MSERPNVLHVEHVTMQFGGVVAMNDLSMDVNEGEIVALIGPNGAGKTTAFNCITGVYEPTNGKIDFCGQPWWRTIPRARWTKPIWARTRALHPQAEPHPRPDHPPGHCPYLPEYPAVRGPDRL